MSTPTQPTVVRVRTSETVAGQFGGTATPSHFYPPNNGNYYRSGETVPEPFNPAARVNWVLMLAEGYRMISQVPGVRDGDRQPGPGGRAMLPAAVRPRLAAEAPGAILADVLRESDGTAQWSFLAL